MGGNSVIYSLENSVYIDNFLLVFMIFETNALLQFLSGCTQTGKCTSGGWDWPQTPLQPPYTLQSTPICCRQPLQECSALAL